MLDAAREAISFAKGCVRADLDNDRKLSLALVKCIEIIGEAANGISPAFQKRHPAVPWPSVIAMRNRLIHAYFDVDLDRVWDTVVDDLPRLIAELDSIVDRE